MVYVLAAASALASAIGGVLQRIGIEKAPPEHALRLRLLVDALRRGVWLLGFAMLLAAFGLQASALRFGGLTVVQPVLTLDLLYVIVILKVVFRRSLGWREIGGSLAIVGGLVAFLASADPSIGQGLPASRPLVVVTVAIAVVAGILVAAARRGPRWWRATAFGAAAGALFAYNASLTKATAKLVTGGWGHVFTHWEPYAIGVTGAFGFFLLQNALHAGPIAASRATMIMVNPVVSIVIGTLVFNEHFRGGPGFVVADAASLAVMLAGGYLLAQSPLVAGATLDGAQGERLSRAVPAT